MSGYLLAILAFVIWGFTSSVILRSVPLPGPVASEAGCLIGAVTLLAVIGPKRWPDVIRLFRDHPLRLAGLAAAFGCCSFTYQWAVKTTTVANAVLTHSLQPILTCLLFVPLWGGAKPTRKGYAALALGMSGLAILIGPQLSWQGSTFETAAGMTLGVVSGASFSWYIVQAPFFSERSDPVTLLTAVVIAAAAMLSPSLAFAGDVAFDWRGTLALLAFALLNFVVANAMYFRAMTRIPVGHVATIAYVEPLVAIVAAAAFLGEPMTLGVLAGGVLILGSGALVMSDRPAGRSDATRSGKAAK